VSGHAVLLEQVATNLLLNARDALANRPLGTPRRIVISAGYGEPGETWLRVADNGGGIRPDVLERIFEPFVTTKAEGTGLGLYTCQQLARELGGALTLQDNPDGPGTVATLTLPLSD